MMAWKILTLGENKMRNYEQLLKKRAKKFKQIRILTTKFNKHGDCKALEASNKLVSSLGRG